jgi:hypothetical protein
MSDIPIDGRATPNHGCDHPRRQRSDKHPLGTCPRVGDQATQPEGFEMNIENLDRAIWFAEEIARPTVDEFRTNPGNQRLGMLAAICAGHLTDYVAGAIEVPLQQLTTQCEALLLVRDVADATKHAVLNRRVGDRVISPLSVDAVLVRRTRSGGGSFPSGILNAGAFEGTESLVTETISVGQPGGSEADLLPATVEAMNFLLRQIDSAIDAVGIE